MSILSHFNRTNAKDYILYQIKLNEIEKVLEKMTKPARLCYISNRELVSLCGKRGISAGDFLEKYICPDEPTIMSGDFGEIFCYCVVTEHLSNKGFVLFAPRKWRWKDDRNKPGPGSDAVIFHRVNPNKPTPKDFVVSIESKMNHAGKDKLSRLAKSIIWLEEKHARDGSEEQRKIIERFKDPSIYGTFDKHHKAIAVIDSLLEADEITTPITNSHGVVALIFSINDLKKVYENLKMNIIKSI